MAEVKVTKREKFTALRDLVESRNEYGEYDYLLDFIDNEINLLDSRASKAKEKAKEKKAAGDEMKKFILNAMTNRFNTVNNIMDNIEGMSDSDAFEWSKQKVVARLTQLVKEGTVQKDTQKIDGSKVTVYYKP